MMTRTFFKNFGETKIASEKYSFLKLLFLCVLAISGTTYGQSQDKAARVDRLMAEQNFVKKPGAAFLVVENGKVIYQKGYGLAELKSEPHGNTNRAKNFRL